MVERKDKGDMMSATEKWKEDLYQEVFHSRIEYLEKRRRLDSTFNRDVLLEMIRTEYTKHDLAWAGKSPVQEITEAATIAAYEHFKAEWKED